MYLKIHRKMKDFELIQVHPDLTGELSDVDYTKSLLISCRCLLFVPVTSNGGFPQDLMTVHFPQELMTLYIFRRSIARCKRKCTWTVSYLGHESICSKIAIRHKFRDNHRTRSH